ncbi:hypothetical protein KPL47_24635, partial [Clostridium estertheticum]|uniref:hypothetical protein n=1 Tax=Clostridium estertheticum TaxID=238834 RepID=UPI001C0D9591
ILSFPEPVTLASTSFLISSEYPILLTMIYFSSRKAYTIFLSTTTILTHRDYEPTYEKKQLSISIKLNLW